MFSLLKIPFIILSFMVYANGDPDPAPNYKTAVVIHAGSTQNGGCGWLIKVGADTFKPKNLPKDFKMDQLQINVDFDRSLTIAKCKWGKKSGVEEIYIQWIEKKK
jgi:hypothetical protein